MLFKGKTKAKLPAQRLEPQQRPSQLSKTAPVIETIELEPTLSEKMYEMLAQGPLGLVSLNDSEGGDDIDMMSILEEGPLYDDAGYDDDDSPAMLAFDVKECDFPKDELPELPQNALQSQPMPGKSSDQHKAPQNSLTAPQHANGSDESLSLEPRVSNEEPFMTPRSSLWSEFVSDESEPAFNDANVSGESSFEKSDSLDTISSGGSDSSENVSEKETVAVKVDSWPSTNSDESESDSENVQKSKSTPNLQSSPSLHGGRTPATRSPPALLESPLRLPKQSALASVLYVSQNPNAASRTPRGSPHRSPATSRSTSPNKHKRQNSGHSDTSDIMSQTTASFKSMSLRSDSSDSDTHSVRSMRSLRSSFRSFSHDSLFALRKSKRDSVAIAPLAPIFSNASTLSPGHDLKALESALSKFQNKQGTPKANILRLELLTLLRKEAPIGAPMEASVALGKWWRAVLDALHSRPSNHDKIAYMEAVSKLMDRPEWKAHESSQFPGLVYQTLRYCIERLSLKSVSVPVAAFSGKTLAYAFFHCPGVAHQLLAHLQVPSSDLERVGPVCDSAVLRPSADGKPSIPLGPWIRRWASSDSDTFYSFLKHYYCISGGTEEAGELPPGWVNIHAFILGSLDAVVRPRKPPAPPSLTPCIPKPRQIHKLKLLAALRELKKCCHPQYFAHVLSPAIEDILKSVSLKTVVFNVEQCTALADLAEEMLTALESPQRSLDAPFWLNVVGIMLRSESHYTTLRALAFLHNTFPEDSASEQYVEFVLEASTVKKYFCHWHPLIRAAYMRLVCYRVLPKAPQKMSHCLTTIYTRLITYMEYCRVNETPLPVTDACSRLRIVSREFQGTAEIMQNLDIVDIGVRRRVMADCDFDDFPSTPPRNTSSRTSSQSSPRTSSPSVTPGATTPKTSTPRYFEDSPPRVSAFDVEDDLFEGMEKHTVKKWGFIRKEVYAHETIETGRHSISTVSSNGISSQFKFVMESSSRSKSPPTSSDNLSSTDEPSVAYPRLPFDLKDKAKDSQSTLDSTTTATTSNTSVDDDSFRVPMDPNEFKDLTEYVKYWKYAGRSLNEWDGVVREYETFVTQCGDGVPHMVGDMGRCAPL